jgi:arylsulfatase A-like enzyme
MSTAHHGDVAAYKKSLTQADDILARLHRVLDRIGERGKATHVFVTADHGRSVDFRSHGRPRFRARVARRSRPAHTRSAGVRPRLMNVTSPTSPDHRDADRCRDGAAPGSGEVLSELFEARTLYNARAALAFRRAPFARTSRAHQ